MDSILPRWGLLWLYGRIVVKENAGDKKNGNIYCAGEIVGQIIRIYLFIIFTKPPRLSSTFLVACSWVYQEKGDSMLIRDTGLVRVIVILLRYCALC